MAESAAQRNARLRAARKSAMSRANGGTTEDAAVEKTVAPSAPAKSNDGNFMANGQSVNDALYTRHRNRAPKSAPPVKPITKGPNRQQKQPGQNKVYTKHVVFALVSAIVIQIVALNKSLPTKG
jgi:hypothetical protein